MKLVSEYGTSWAVKDNSMVFGNVVWLCDINDIKQYQLLDKDKKPIKIKPEDYLVKDDFDEDTDNKGKTA